MLYLYAIRYMSCFDDKAINHKYMVICRSNASFPQNAQVFALVLCMIGRFAVEQARHLPKKPVPNVLSPL